MIADSSDRDLRVLVAHPGADLYGSDLVMLESVSGFRQAGARVSVTLPTTGALTARLEASGATVLLCPAPVLRKSILRPGGAVRFAVDAARGLFRGIRLIRAVRPDVIYVSTVTLPLWPLLARLTGTPVVVHLHEAERSMPLVARRMLAAPLLLAHTLVSNSDHCIDVVSEAFPSLRQRAVVLRNPISWPERPAISRARLSDPFRVIYLGRVSERKGVDTAVRAVAALRSAGCPATLDIVGSVFPGYESYLESLHTLIDDLGLDDAVRLHGYQSDVWSWLGASDVVVVPSRGEEGFGDTAVEGILAARPIIVSDFSGLREASAGFTSAQRVPPEDIVAWTDALRRVHTEWAHFRRVAATDTLLARERHSKVAYRAEIVRVLRRTVSAGASSHIADAVQLSSNPRIGE
ncbi:glycosyltransferase [Glaciibacter sp. 2TAF33]|uniref:glycosyltransferase n=1 Tax=Glaciibacter sp. 2TAF33 TaxID=3233015 RepID=UPI003F8E3FC0